MRRLPEAPLRGDVWLADLDPVMGHEQGGTRPTLIISRDDFNAGPARRVVIVPLTTRERGLPLHVEISPPSGGLVARSFAVCEDVRSISRQRLRRRLGSVPADTVEEVADRLRILLVL